MAGTVPPFQHGLCFPGLISLWGDGRAVAAVVHGPSPPSSQRIFPQRLGVAAKAHSCVPLQGLPLAEREMPHPTTVRGNKAWPLFSFQDIWEGPPQLQRPSWDQPKPLLTTVSSQLNLSLCPLLLTLLPLRCWPVLTRNKSLRAECRALQPVSWRL